MNQKKRPQGDLSRRDFLKTTGMILAAGAVLQSSPAHANKSAVRIVAPETAAAGEQINIELHVSHSGNNFFHYTNWVYVRINEQEVQRWIYGSGNRPKSENFILTLQHTLTEPIEIKAEANCNMHGSEGVSQARVALG
jgi:desulfoferrodoxin (superoxide reductase-like protein)